MKTIVLCVMGVLLVAAPARGQQVDPDSVVAAFIQDGWDGWIPAEAFRGCPDLEPWQRRAFALLTGAQLSPRRQLDLTEALATPFANCGDEALETWWFAQVERNMVTPGEIPFGIWKGLAEANHERARAKLYEWLSDRNAPSQIRISAAQFYFEKFPQGERFAAFMDEYERGVVPTDYAGLAISVFAHQRPGEIASRLGQMVRREPGRFLNDPAFEVTFVSDIMRGIPRQARAEFIANVRAATRSPDVSQERREVLEAALKRAENLPDPR